MSTQHANTGYSIEAELDAHGSPTGKFLVINSDGKIVHVAESFEDAMKWIDEQDDTPPPPGSSGPKM